MQMLNQTGTLFFWILLNSHQVVMFNTKKKAWLADFQACETHCELAVSQPSFRTVIRNQYFAWLNLTKPKILFVNWLKALWGPNVCIYEMTLWGVHFSSVALSEAEPDKVGLTAAPRQLGEELVTRGSLTQQGLQESFCWDTETRHHATALKGPIWLLHW